LAQSFSENQAGTIAFREWHQATVLTRTVDIFESPESYTAVLQRQNVALQSEVTQLHQQVRDLQLALVIEKALGMVNSKVRLLPGSAGLVAP
jgi:hypothetical protein